MEKEPTKQIAIDLEESLLVDLQKIADRHHVALNKLIPTLIQAQLINSLEKFQVRGQKIAGSR